MENVNYEIINYETIIQCNVHLFGHKTCLVTVVTSFVDFLFIDTSMYRVQLHVIV